MAKYRLSRRAEADLLSIGDFTLRKHQEGWSAQQPRITILRPSNALHIVHAPALEKFCYQKPTSETPLCAPDFSSGTLPDLFRKVSLGTKEEKEQDIPLCESRFGGTSFDELWDDKAEGKIKTSSNRPTPTRALKGHLRRVF
jgi:hypothetical protein